MVINNLKRFFSSFCFALTLLISLVLNFAFTEPVLAASEPVITSITPKLIPQGETKIAVVEGSNLNQPISVLGVKGGGVLAFVLSTNPNGNSITVQIVAERDATLGTKEFFIRTDSGSETTGTFEVITANAPIVDAIYPNNANPGTTRLVNITGMGLSNILSIETSNKQDILINSFQAYIHGDLINLSISVSENALTPATHEIFIQTLGGQAKAYFNVLPQESQANTLSDSYSYNNIDPFSPGIYSVEINPENRGQFILKGSMFDPDPIKNIVTILENNEGTVTGREVNVLSSNNNEIVIELPQDVGSSNISLAVANSDGKSSNIKNIDLDTITNKVPSSSTTNDTNEEQNTDLHVDIAVSNIGSDKAGVQTTPSVIAIAGSNQEINIQKEQSPQVINNPNEKQPEKTLNESANNTEVFSGSLTSKNVQNLTQYLFSSNPLEIKGEVSPSSVEKVTDLTKIISTLEENKQIKNQVELIMLALDDVKNQELNSVIKKAEDLKTKVESLEKLLSTEKQKARPDPKKLANYQKLLTNANSESRSQTFVLLNNLFKYKPQLKNLLTQKPFDLAAIQPNIPNNSIILQYVPTEEGLIIFVVDNKSLKTRINKNISQDILNREIQAYRQLFEKEIEKIRLTSRVTPITSWKNDKSQTYKKEILPLKEKNIFLYNALISPVEKDIANKQVVAIIANGWLRYLPFQSLAKPTQDGDLKFLISDKSIVYLDSVLALGKSPSSPLSNKSTITIFANPDGTLAGANKEAELITKLFNKTVKSFVQKPFTVPIVNQFAKQSEILHLATHGYLDGSDINSSYLVKGKKSNNGKIVQDKLFLKDIYDLNLTNSKLVVLSGCDTGKLGNLSSEPDDIVGSLATAFRVAGANTILASLWKSHDDATKLMMQYFYENIRLGFNKAESLRKAELKVKENPKYSHPLFWSLFNLVGDWR